MEVREATGVVVLGEDKADRDMATTAVAAWEELTAPVR
jgi:hypothetical protein